ncbi:MAG: type III secretion system chaperone [Candidatus Methylacidiphilales bacterium]|nr:type III secretion system chaperone [Candidatus Methylacidiphilales bacterium]
MSIINLLSELGSHMGMNQLRPNEHGICRLVFDQKLKVDLEPSEDGKSLLVYTKVGEIPHGAASGFYRMLLDASLFGRGTGGGATLALDGDAGEVFLQAILPLDKLDAIVLSSTLEDFLNTAETWVSHFEANEFPHWDEPVTESGSATRSSGNDDSAERALIPPSDEDIALGRGMGGFIRA